jgi:uncharacterized protein (DUF4415 family)
MSSFKELTDEELKSLSDDELFVYLDAKAKHLRETNIVKPLGSYHTKHFAAFTKGDALTTEELKKAKELGRAGDEAYSESIREAADKQGGDPKFKDPKIKVKVRGGGWVD